MSNQAAAVPAAGQTNPPTADAPQLNVQTAAEERRSAILTAYDALRPASEVDSRAQRVLVASLVLIALCVVPQKPSAVSFGGVSFSFGHWLALAIPLCVVVLYTVAEMAVAWRIQWKRVTLVVTGAIDTLENLVDEDKRARKAWREAFLIETQKMEGKRKEVWDWHEQRRAELQAEDVELDKKARFPNDFYVEQLKAKNYEAFRQEYQKRMEDAELPAFDRKVDYMWHVALDQDAIIIQQNKDALREIAQFPRLKKLRLAMGLFVPVVVSAFSLLTFAWAIYAVLRAR